MPPPSRRGLVFPAVGRPAAEAALHLLGHPGWLVPWTDGDVLVLGDVRTTVAVAGVVSDTTAGPVAVVLWVDPDEEAVDADEIEPVAGVVLVHQGRAVTAHSWTAGEGEAGDAHVMAKVIGRPEAEVGLRALLRRESPDPVSLLPELVALVDLPAAAPALLTAPDAPPGTVFVPEVGGTQRVGAFRAVLADVPEPGWADPLRRWGFLMPAVLAAYFAVRAVVAGLTGPTEDLWGYGTLCLVAVLASVWRAHRSSRRARRSDRG